MTIASEIEDLQTNLTAAKNAVTAKGGTTGNTGLAGLATEIASIPSGGSSATQWGELSYYSSWTEQFSADPGMWQNCTVIDIDNNVYADWLSLHPELADSPDVTFRYDEYYDPDTGSSTGEYYWFYGWDNNNKIDPNDMISTTGIAVTGYVGYSYASFTVTKTITVDTTSQIVKAELSQDMYNRLTSDSLDNSGEYYVLGGGLRIYREAITGFTFGTQPTTTPAGFLNSAPLLTSIDMSHATSLTSIGNSFLVYCTSFNQQITIPNTVTSIGDSFLVSNTSYNQPITIPNTVTTIGREFLHGCTGFNSTVTLPDSLTTIGALFMRGDSLFNQPLSIPSTVTTIGGSFLSGCSSFNQPITIPSGVTTIGDDFLSGCQSFSQPLVFPNGLTNLGGILAQVSNYNQPITIPNTVTSIGYGFLRQCSSFDKPLALPSGLVSIGQFFLAGCSSFNQPLTLSSSITSIGHDFMNECRSMVSVITCEASSSVLDSANYYRNAYLSTTNSSAPCYVTGIPIGGSKSSEWLSFLPHRSTSPYRNLIAS